MVINKNKKKRLNVSVSMVSAEMAKVFALNVIKDGAESSVISK